MRTFNAQSGQISGVDLNPGALSHAVVLHVRQRSLPFAALLAILKAHFLAISNPPCHVKAPLPGHAAMSAISECVAVSDWVASTQDWTQLCVWHGL